MKNQLFCTQTDLDEHAIVETENGTDYPKVSILTDEQISDIRDALQFYITFHNPVFTEISAKKERMRTILEEL